MRSTHSSPDDLQIDTCIHVYTFTYTYIYMYTHLHLPIYNICMSVYTHTYTHTHTHTHTHACMYTHIHTHTCRAGGHTQRAFHTATRRESKADWPPRAGVGRGQRALGLRRLPPRALRCSSRAGLVGRRCLCVCVCVRACVCE